jgi:hypothetical protein
VACDAGPPCPRFFGYVEGMRAPLGFSPSSSRGPASPRRAVASGGPAGLGLGLGLATAGSGLALGSILLALGATLGAGGCGALRQNLKNEFVSYRGAWSCESAGCKSSEVVQSKRGRTQGELRISEVRLQPHAGLVFYPGKPVKTLTATVRDCKGKSKEVPSDKVQPPGRHEISAEPDSWVIWLDEALVADLEVGKGDCAVLIVKTHSSWDDGKVYDAEGAIEVGG